MHSYSRWLKNLSCFCTILLCSMSFPAQAQSKAVTLVVPYPPGGSADVIARLIAQNYSQDTGTTMIVENKPGAGAIIGARHVINAKPDGKTLLLGTVSSQVMTPAINPNAKYDAVNDFTPISFVASMPFMLIAKTEGNIKDLETLKQTTQTAVHGVRYSSAGIGTSNHLAGLLFAKQADVPLEHIPYNGSSPALTALLANDVDIMFDLILTTLPYVDSKKVIPIGITSHERSRFAQDIPTLQELGVADFDVSAWFGIFAPANTDPQIAEALNRDIEKVLSSPEIQERFLKLGIEPTPMPLNDFSQFIQAESSRWNELIQNSNIAITKE